MPAIAHDALARLTRLEEALELGDVGFALELTRNLRHDLGSAVQAKRLAVCPICGVDCKWPGRLAAHTLNVHNDWSRSTRGSGS